MRRIPQLSPLIAEGLNMGLERDPGSSVSLVGRVNKVDEISEHGDLTIEPGGFRGTTCCFICLPRSWRERGSDPYPAEG